MQVAALGCRFFEGFQRLYLSTVSKLCHSNKIQGKERMFALESTVARQICMIPSPLCRQEKKLVTSSDSTNLNRESVRLYGFSVCQRGDGHDASWNRLKAEVRVRKDFERTSVYLSGPCILV